MRVPTRPPAGSGPDQGARPAALDDVAPEKLVELDVREALRAGQEPFSQIMEAVRTIPQGGVFRLRATFEPVPLYAVLGRQGFSHWTERLADDDWRVWFFTEADDAAPAQPSAAAPETPVGSEEDVVVLDVRGMEPPEPMVRTLAALESLPAGKTLLQINVRVPQFLLPHLEERGYSYSIQEQADADVVRVFIRRRAE